ncbi:MAG: SWIM zinc finger family protein [Caulobacteraceae bacterium]
MNSLADLLVHDTLTRLAKPANLRLGRAIVEEGGVEFVRVEPARMTARVGGTPASPQRRTVELTAASGELSWSCACTGRRDLFCKHCVAAAMALT